MLLLLLPILSVSANIIYDGPLTLYLAFRDGFPLEEADQSLKDAYPAIGKEPGSTSLTAQYTAVKAQIFVTPTEPVPVKGHESRNLLTQPAGEIDQRSRKVTAQPVKVKGQGSRSLSQSSSSPYKQMPEKNISTQPGSVVTQGRSFSLQPAPVREQGSIHLSSQPTPMRGQGSRSLGSQPTPMSSQKSRSVTSEPTPMRGQGSRSMGSQPTPTSSQKSRSVASEPTPVRGQSSRSLASAPTAKSGQGSRSLSAPQVKQETVNSTPQPKLDGRRTLSQPERKADWTLPSDKHYPYCGTRHNPLSRIIGGRDAKKASWPWIAALGYMVGSEVAFLCGGTLITEKHVLTAAHCLGSDWPLKYVLLGATEIILSPLNQKNLLPVATIHVHESYNPMSHENDITILTLQKPATYSATVKPICLPLSATLRASNYKSHLAKVAGWGATVWDGKGTKKLQEVSLPVISLDNCNWAHREGGRIDHRFLCAGYLNGTKDTCSGDSGGPLVWEDGGFSYIIGIVSYGYKCAEVQYPGVYIKVAEYLGWIFKTLQYP